MVIYVHIYENKKAGPTYEYFQWNKVITDGQLLNLSMTTVSEVNIRFVPTCACAVRN